jgi:nucleoside-diphosphate kinase
VTLGRLGSGTGPILEALRGRALARFDQGNLVALVVSGDEAIAVIRTLIGSTDGRKAAPGSIRGDFSLSNRENLVHASDSVDSAKREIALWFPELAG